LRRLVLGVIERGDALELLPRFKASGRQPTVVRKRRSQSNSLLDPDRLDKPSERALCADGRNRSRGNSWQQQGFRE
jgi:hypothetical protein